MQSWASLGRKTVAREERWRHRRVRKASQREERWGHDMFAPDKIQFPVAAHALAPRAPAALSQWVTLYNLARSFFSVTNSHRLGQPIRGMVSPWKHAQSSTNKSSLAQRCLVQNPFSDGAQRKFSLISLRLQLPDCWRSFFNLCPTPLHFLQSIP